VRNYDLEFLKHFSMVIGFLMLVTAGLIVGAYFLHDSLPPEVNPKAAQITEARIAPAGAVYAGETGAAAQAAAVVVLAPGAAIAHAVHAQLEVELAVVTGEHDEAALSAGHVSARKSSPVQLRGVRS